MKASLGEIKQRIQIKENKTEGILNYDIDNSYPQRMISLVGASGTASSCVDLLARFTRGRGFKDKIFYKTRVNSFGLTLDKLLRKTTNDYAHFLGFAIHVNYNANFKISELNYVPFENCRLTVPDATGYISKIALHSDWARLKSKLVRKSDIIELDVFNPNPEIIAAQVKAAGGFSSYKGQILWYSPEGMEYPLAVYDSVTEDIITDAGIKNYRKRSVKNGFMASHLLYYYGEFEDDTERDEFKSELTLFQGDEVSNKIMMIDGVTKDTKPELAKVESPNVDKMFESTTRTAKDSIIERFNQPPILLGKNESGMFADDKIKLAFKYYNSITIDDRTIFEEIFTELFKYYKDAVNVSGDYSIIPLTWDEEPKVI